MSTLFDNRSLETLEAIYTYNGFASAAKILGISQSAVSQRFKSLQKSFGDMLLIRSTPYQLTSKGKKLVNYIQKIKHLEDVLSDEMGLKQKRHPLRISLSRDMLDTWFLNVLKNTNIMNKVQIALTTVDQEETLSLLKRGEVNVAFSPSSLCFSEKKPSYIGSMTYICISTPCFQKRYFPKNILLKSALKKAPCLVYDRKDNLYFKYLKKYWQINPLPFVVHTIPSVFCFKQLVLQGEVMALIPYIDVQQEISSGKLINLFPQNKWDIPIYMHTCDYLGVSDRKILQQIFQETHKILIFS